MCFVPFFVISPTFLSFDLLVCVSDYFCYLFANLSTFLVLRICRCKFACLGFCILFSICVTVDKQIYTFKHIIEYVYINYKVQKA